jgi:hypothetical protein
MIETVSADLKSSKTEFNNQDIPVSQKQQYKEAAEKILERKVIQQTIDYKTDVESLQYQHTHTF